jgi:hypothetical protein
MQGRCLIIIIIIIIMVEIDEDESGFGIVIVVVVQSIFCLEMFQNKFFLFFKNYF